MHTQTEIICEKAKHTNGKADAMAKELLKYKELIAPILQAVVSELQDMSVEEIIEYLDEADLKSRTPVADVRVAELGTEFKSVSEKLIYMDVYFRMKNPKLSDSNLNIFMRLNMEMQNNYHPGYSLESRGIYYLSRAISSQLNPVTKDTDYKRLEKVYSIWLTNDNIPRKEQNSISRYYMTKEDMVGKSCPSSKYDLMELIIIRMGNKLSEEDIFKYLRALFKGETDIVKTFTPLSNEAERKVRNMKTYDQTIFEQGLNQGITQGIAQGIVQGITQGFIKGIAQMFNKGFVSLQDAAKEAGLSEVDFKKYAEELKVKNE